MVRFFVGFAGVPIIVSTLAGLAVAGSVARRTRWSRWAVVVTVASLGTVLAVTLVTRGPFGPRGSIPGFHCIGPVFGGFSSPIRRLNLVLMAPLAFGVAAGSRRFRTAAFTVITVTLVVEVTQGLLHVGVCEYQDMVANIGGGLVVAAATVLVFRLIDRQGHRPTPGDGPARVD